jgi:hypothetical protein
LKQIERKMLNRIAAIVAVVSSAAIYAGAARAQTPQLWAPINHAVTEAPDQKIIPESRVGSGIHVGGIYVHAKANDTVGCVDSGTLRAFKQQSAGVALPEGWQERIVALKCYPVASDLKWQVADKEFGYIHLRISEGDAPAPVLWFCPEDFEAVPRP